jgi:hypothetical protein
VAQQHKIIPNRLALVVKESVSVGHRRQRPRDQPGEPTQAHLQASRNGRVAAGSAAEILPLSGSVSFTPANRKSAGSFQIVPWCQEAAFKEIVTSTRSVVQHSVLTNDKTAGEPDHPARRFPLQQTPYWSMPPEAWVNQAVALLIAPAASEASMRRSLTSRFPAAVTAAV